MRSYIELLQQKIRTLGVPLVAERSGLAPARVELFLQDCDNTRVTEMLELGRAANMPPGTWHVSDASGNCLLCEGPCTATMPMFPER